MVAARSPGCKLLSLGGTVTHAPERGPPEGGQIQDGVPPTFLPRGGPSAVSSRNARAEEDSLLEQVEALEFLSFWNISPYLLICQ